MPPRAAASWRRGDPIVVFGDDWGRNVSTMQHLFRHIAVDHPVIWVNAIGHRAPTLSLSDMRRAWQKIRGVGRSQPAPSGWGFSEGAAPSVIIQPHVLPWHGFGPAHALNTALLLRAIRTRLKALQLTRPPLLITGTPPSAGIVGRLGEAASVYFCMDDFLNFPGVDAKMIAPLERRLLGSVDALVATAASLTRTKRPASGRVFHLPQGVNFEHFAEPRSEPGDLRPIPRPRIGFAGSVGGYCDLELVARVAERYASASIVLVGPVTAPRSTVDSITRLPNVHVLGARQYRDLPAYVQAFDVAMVPYLRNATTLAVDPLKVLEYLAAGPPVVATSIPEIGKYADVVTVADDDDHFVQAIGRALSCERQGIRERGQAVARENTWARRAKTLLSIVTSLR